MEKLRSHIRKRKNHASVSLSPKYDPVNKKIRKSYKIFKRFNVFLENNSSINITGLSNQIRQYFYNKLNRALTDKLEVCTNRDTFSWLQKKVHVNLAGRIEGNIFRNIKTASEYKCLMIQKILEITKCTEERSFYEIVNKKDNTALPKLTKVKIEQNEEDSSNIVEVRKEDSPNIINSSPTSNCTPSKDVKPNLMYRKKQSNIERFNFLSDGHIFENHAMTKLLPLNFEIVEVRNIFRDGHKVC